MIARRSRPRRWVGAWALVALLLPRHASAGPDSAETIFEPIMEIDLRADGRRAWREQKHLLIMFTKEGCGPCERMKRQVFPDSEVERFFRARFVAYEVNILGDLPIVDVHGEALTEKQYARREAIWGTPAFYFFGEKGELVFKHTGALSKKKLMALGEFVAAGFYRP